MEENTEESTIYWTVRNLYTEWARTLWETKAGCKHFNCMYYPSQANGNQKRWEELLLRWRDQPHQKNLGCLVKEDKDIEEIRCDSR